MNQIDPRGPRFGAAVTSVVLAVVLLTGSAALLAVQAVVFALGSRGRSPYALLWKRLPTSPPTELEDAAPPRFAQLVGLGFAVGGVAGYALGASVVGAVFTSLALVAAVLNASIGLCLGCEVYLLFRRIKGVTA